MGHLLLYTCYIYVINLQHHNLMPAVGEWRKCNCATSDGGSVTNVIDHARIKIQYRNGVVLSTAACRQVLIAAACQQVLIAAACQQVLIGHAATATGETNSSG